MMRQRGWLMAAIVIMTGCGSNSDGPPLSADTKPESAPADGAVAASQKAATKNYPQEELAKKADSIKITGTVTVPGYEKGKIQIDVLPPGEATEGQSPLTTVQVGKPGPYELLLPAGTTEVRLTAILDFDSNGPNASDATADYAGNPLQVKKKTSGVDFTIDKTHVRAPPPPDSEVSQTDNKPPWEKEGAAKAPATPSGSDGPEPDESAVGAPVPAPPGSKEGPREGALPGE